MPGERPASTSVQLAARKDVDVGAARHDGVGCAHREPVLTQEERRNIFETKSHHIAEGVRYLPSVARQLYHSRDIGEPFDFLTWFEYAPQHSEAFEDLVRTLRKTEEWQHVDRVIDIRLTMMREPES
jgi:hypothetical protein